MRLFNLETNQPTILPLPFLKGEGWGEGWRRLPQSVST